MQMLLAAKEFRVCGRAQGFPIALDLRRQIVIVTPMLLLPPARGLPACGLAQGFPITLDLRRQTSMNALMPDL